MHQKRLRIQHGSTMFLRTAIFAIAGVVLVLCVFALPAVWIAVPKEYHAGMTYVLYSIIALMYVAAVPFFMALYQALRLLTHIDTHKAFSGLAVKALNRITHCAIAISAIYVVSLPLFYVWAENDDAPGLIVIGMLLTAAPLVVAVFAAVLQRVFHEAIAIKSENDLTV